MKLCDNYTFSAQVVFDKNTKSNVTSDTHKIVFNKKLETYLQNTD